MFKKFSLAIAFVAVMSVRVMADDSIEIGANDVASVTDADNAVVGASVDVNVDDLAKNDKSDVAVEACFRHWGGGCGYNYGCYSSCYYPCYSYSYCYYPTYFCYRPVTYYTPCYSYNYCSYPLSYWGCY
jgi:hypothetical protein